MNNWFAAETQTRKHLWFAKETVIHTSGTPINMGNKTIETASVVWSHIQSIGGVIQSLMEVPLCESHNNSDDPKNVKRYHMMSDMYHLATIPDIIRSALSFDTQWYSYLNNTPYVHIRVSQDDLIRLEKQVGCLPESYRNMVYSYLLAYLHSRKKLYACINDKQYKEHAEKLLANIRGIPVENLSLSTIHAHLHTESIYFEVDDRTYQMLQENETWPETSIWFAGGINHIEDLRGSVMYGKRSANNIAKIQIHEARHIANKKIMALIPAKRNKARYTPYTTVMDHILTLAKDEIIAYTADGSDYHRIFTTLTQSPLYDYTADFQKRWATIDFEKLRRDYNQRLETLIKTALIIRKREIPHALDLLAIFPISNWWLLQKLFLDPKQYVKYKNTRKTPFLFDHDFASLSDEWDVLHEMYQIDPIHTAKPIYRDKANEFYITEKHSGIYPELITWFASGFFEKFQSVIQKFHIQWIAHGDLHLANIIFLWDKETGIVNDFHIIDPVWISKKKNRKYLRQAMDQDLIKLQEFKVYIESIVSRKQGLSTDRFSWTKTPQNPLKDV